jgi:hypothetical protein
MAIVVAMNTGIFAVLMVHKLLWTYSLKNQSLTIKVRQQLRNFPLPEWFQMTTDIRSIILQELEDMSSSTRLKRRTQ